MKEIISFYVGQAGIQIGSSIWELFCAEHNISYDGILMDNQLENECLETFFNQTSANTWVPRSLFVDLEPTVIDEIRKGIFKNLFHPERLINGPEDASNNFSRGFFTVGKLILSTINEQGRHLFEQCDMVQGLIILRSLGGGTGAGLTSAMFEGLSDYPKTPKIEIPIYPSPTLSTSMVEPYNCLLGEHFCMEDIDVGLLLDNEALFEICSKYLVIEYPTYNTINRLIAQVVSSITASVRFVNVLNCDLTVLQTNMVPYPRIHFPLCNFAPIMNQEKANHQELTVQELTRLVFDRSNQMMKVDHFYGKFMSCALFYRGNVCPHHVYLALSEIKRDQSIEFVDWCPTGFKVGINAVSPVIIPDSKLAATKKNVAMLTNTSAIGQAWQRLTHRFYLLYSKRSFIHWFIGEGMEECEFTEALYNISALVKDYEEAGENTTNIINNIGPGSNQPGDKNDEGKADDNLLEKDENYLNAIEDKSTSNSIWKSSFVLNNKSEVSRMNSEDNVLSTPKNQSNLSLDQSNKSNHLFDYNLDMLKRLMSIDLNENVLRRRQRQNSNPEFVSVATSSKCLKGNSKEKFRLLNTNSNFPTELNPSYLLNSEDLMFLKTPNNETLLGSKNASRPVSKAVTTVNITSYNSDLDNGFRLRDIGTNYKSLENSKFSTNGHIDSDSSKRPMVYNSDKTSLTLLDGQNKYNKFELSDCSVSPINESVPKIHWGLKSPIQDLDAILRKSAVIPISTSVENPQVVLNREFTEKMKEIQQTLMRYLNENRDKNIADETLSDLFNFSTDFEKSDGLSCNTLPVLSQSEIDISRESDVLYKKKGTKIRTVLELKSNSQTSPKDKNDARFQTSRWNSFINNLSENTQISDSETVSDNSQSNYTISNNISKEKRKSNTFPNSQEPSCAQDLKNLAKDVSVCRRQDIGLVRQIIDRGYNNESDTKSNRSKDSQSPKLSISHNWKPLDNSKDTDPNRKGLDSQQSGVDNLQDHSSQILKFRQLNEPIHTSERSEDNTTFITKAIYSSHVLSDGSDNSLTMSDKDCHQLKCANNNGSTAVKSSKTFKVNTMLPSNKTVECTKLFLSDLSRRNDVQTNDSIVSNGNFRSIPRKFRNHLLDEENQSRSNDSTVGENTQRPLPEDKMISRKKFTNEMFNCMVKLREKTKRNSLGIDRNPKTTNQNDALQCDNNLVYSNKYEWDSTPGSENDDAGVGKFEVNSKDVI